MPVFIPIPFHAWPEAGQKHQGHVVLALFSRSVSAIWPTLQCSFTWFAVFWFALERLKPSPLGQLLYSLGSSQIGLLNAAGALPVCGSEPF